MKSLGTVGVGLMALVLGALGGSSARAETFCGTFERLSSCGQLPVVTEVLRVPGVGALRLPADCDGDATFACDLRSSILELMEPGQAYCVVGNLELKPLTCAAGELEFVSVGRSAR